MALTQDQKARILMRLLMKAQSGQIDIQELIAALVAAYDNNRAPLQALAAAELTQWKLDLQAGKAAADAQSTSIAAELAALG